MKGEGSNDFDINELDKKIREQKNIVSRKEDSQNPIKKNPKASLAIASIVFAALVIGMIATFGGVGMIDGALLGKVILTAVTAGTAAFGAKKLYDTVKGDKDKNQLRKLERIRDDFKRSQTKQKAKEAELALANKKKEAEDQRMVDRAIKESWEKEGDEVKKTNKGFIYTTAKLTPDQMALYEERLKLNEAKDALKDIKEKLSDTQTESIDNSIKILSTKLGMSDTDSNKTEDLKKLLSVDVKKSDGADLDTSSSSPTNGNLLKEVLQAGLGLDKDGKASIKQDSPDFIDPQGRINILKGLNDALEFDSTNSYPKFKDQAGKTFDPTFKELKELVAKEKKRTADAKAKSARGAGK